MAVSGEPSWTNQAHIQSPATVTLPSLKIYSGPLRPVGFVNHGVRNAVVRAWTWLPTGANEPAPPSRASTVSAAPDTPGLWPNSSRFLSLPLGTYTWCIDWEMPDEDEDGYFDYYHFIDERPVTLTEDDPVELDLARQVDITVPPNAAPIYPGKCAEHVQATACNSGNVETITHSVYALEGQDPPELYANANQAEYPSPPGITVQYGDGTTAWGINRILWANGDWAAATTTEPFKAIGVQVHGDHTIGWARVMFDGSEVWRGNAAGSTIADGRYGVYVEVRCFGPGQHTIRIEALGLDGGGGGRSIPVSYFGFRR